MERRKQRRWMVLGIWLCAMLLMAGQGLWAIWQYRTDAEARLLSEAGRAAARVAGLLSLSGGRPEAAAALVAVDVAMDAARVYGVRLQAAQGAQAGMRRNHQWEPVPWDGEIMEETVQGMSQIKEEGRPVGSVEIYMSRRLTREECALAVRAEAVRFALNALFFSVLLLWTLRRYGDLARLSRFLRERWQGLRPEEACDTPLSAGELAREGAPALPPSPPAPEVVDLEKGRRYMEVHSEAVHITAGLFRQTFLEAPALMGRLFARGAVAELSHLGRLLEVAAPCLGAATLMEAASAMQRALNDPHCETPALAVEGCARALDDVLAALG